MDNWEDAGRQAARVSDIFLACLSEKSASRKGFLDTELKRAYEIVMKESPSRNLGVIPVRLAVCDIPPELEGYAWANLFEREGFSRLVGLIRGEWKRRQGVSEVESGVAERSTPITFRVVQLQQANTTEIEAAISVAAKRQQAFSFEFHGETVSVDADVLESYGLKSGGLDVIEFVRCSLERESFRELASNRLVFVTSLPISDKNLASKYSGRTVEELNRCCVLENGLHFAPNVAIISTYVWDHLPARPGISTAPSSRRALQPFLFSQFAKVALNSCVDMQSHGETRGCLFDCYDKVEDFDHFFDGGCICDPCEHILESASCAGQIGVEQLASVRRLLNLAVGRKECAIVTAPGSEFRDVYDLVEQVVRGKKWAVRRPSMIPHPLGVLDRLLTSGLVITDVTAEDPYVSYLASIAQAKDRDLLLLLQDNIPFNVQTERVIRYQRSNAGYI